MIVDIKDNMFVSVCCITFGCDQLLNLYKYDAVEYGKMHGFNVEIF